MILKIGLFLIISHERTRETAKSINIILLLSINTSQPTLTQWLYFTQYISEYLAIIITLGVPLI